jgi:hypothetical protein
MLLAGKWVELEDFMLSQVSQAEEIKGNIFPHVEVRPIR